MNTKYTIGVVFGGASAEHDISTITGQYVISMIKKLGHQVIPIYIGLNNEWYSDQKLGVLSFFKEKQDMSKYAGWRLGSSDSKAIISKKTGLGTKTHTMDMLFPALHGTNGEDGAFQGLCQMFGIPYAGSPMEGSVAAMNKTLTKKIIAAEGITTPRYYSIVRSDWENNQESILDAVENQLTYPVFTKPPHAGSSIGISKVGDRAELKQGIEVAFHYDAECLIEEGVSGARDITVAVLGNSELVVSLSQESHSDELLTYEDKYINDGGAQFGGSDEVMTIPADLDATTEKEITRIAKQVYEILGMKGTARVDFLVSDTNEVSVIEVNPLPGTLYNHLWEKSGVSGQELVSRLIELGFEAHKEAQETSHQFNSSILQHANSMKLKVD